MKKNSDDIKNVIDLIDSERIEKKKKAEKTKKEIEKKAKKEEKEEEQNMTLEEERKQYEEKKLAKKLNDVVAPKRELRKKRVDPCKSDPSYIITCVMS